MTQHTQSMSGFHKLGISPKVLAVLDQHKLLNPTPIQEQAIPVALTGKDVIGIAQTGTGKTLAFGLPMLQRIAAHKGQALVLVPTRELALQVEESLMKIGRSFGLKTAVIIGGASMREQVNRLRRNPHVIIATPGRLVDHMQQKTVSFERITMVVLDEADRMFDIGFAPQIKQILAATPKNRQTMLFSATMPHAIAAMATQSMQDPIRIEVAPAGTSSSQVEQGVHMIPQEVKQQLLEKILEDNPGTVLVFTRTKYRAKKVAAAIRHKNHTAVEIHSDRSLAQRKNALQGFKNGTYRILVATDIAARGIDVTGISLVVNYDLPDNAEDYVHRIGRTGRAGHVGRAVSFATPDQQNKELRDIQRLIRKNLNVLPHPITFSLMPTAVKTEQHGQKKQYGGFRGKHKPHFKKKNNNHRFFSKQVI